MADADDQVAQAQADDGRSAEELVAAYRRGPASLRAEIEAMDLGQLRARPIEGKMSSLEVLGHLADSEQYLADRVKRAVCMERPLLVGVDGWTYLDALHYQERDPELQLRLIEVTREQLAADLDRIAPEDWKKTGIHTETGLVTVRGLLLHSIRHLEWHVATVRQKREALGAAL